MTHVIRTTVGVLARLVTAGAIILIIVDAAQTLIARGDWLLGIGAILLAPITIFVWPIFGDGDGVGQAEVWGLPLWWILVASVIAYPVSTFIGDLPPLNRPRDIFDLSTWIPARRGPGLESLLEHSSDTLLEDRFERVSARWDALFAEENNPTIHTPALHEALALLRTLTADSPNGGAELDEAALNAVWTLGSAGYCWRLAEEQTEGRPNNHYLSEFAKIMDERPEEPPLADTPTHRVLFFGACECANRVQAKTFRVWSGCPGGVGVQFDFFQLGLDQAIADVVAEDSEVTYPDLFYAFTFGLGLRDTERWLDEVPLLR